MSKGRRTLAEIPPLNLEEFKRIISESPSSDKDVIVRTKMEYDAHEIARKEIELRGLSDNIIARKIYAKLIFLLNVAWLGAILWIIIASGSGWYKISDTVLVALITSTTVNITAFFLVVTRYLFPSAKTD